ncbi:hypothetical protein NE865_04413 [Phthorimaea operculella]|nr:hypothetical protein NE865_04413 [Phthorimaea operculella]
MRTTKFQDLSYSFDEIQTKIEQLDEVDSEKQLEERETTENKIYSLLAQAQDLLDLWQGKGDDGEGSHDHSNCSNNSLKLPPIKIPSFDGKSHKWLEFRDMYLALIHNSNKIDKVSKFHYLKSYLESSASQVISSVTVSADNYPIAWSLLCERFDNKRLLTNEHLKCLFSIEQMNKESDKGIRNLIDTLSKNLSALKVLGEKTDEWDTLIIYIASAKLDTVTLRKWEEFRGNESPTLNDFYSFLRQRAEVLETINQGSSSAMSSATNKNERRPSLNKSKTFIAATRNATNYKNSCLFCTQDHNLYDCAKFKALPVEDRSAKYWTMEASRR